MHGYFVRWLSVTPEDLKSEIAAERRLVQECLQLLGYSRSKLERNQTPAGRLAKQTCQKHSVMLAHQRTDQQHRTFQKHSPPLEEAEAGARIAWVQTYRVHGGLSLSGDRSQHHGGKAGWKDTRTVSVTKKMSLPWLGGFLCDCILLN